MNSFILTFDDTTISRREMVECLDRLDGVVDWLAFLPTAIAILSPHTTHELTSMVNAKRPGIRFIVTVGGAQATDGQLPRMVWDFINRPQPAAGRPHDSRGETRLSA